MVALVTVADLLTGASAQVTHVLLDDVQAVTSADFAVVADPPLTRSKKTVPARWATYDVPEYVVLDGKPMPVTDQVIVVQVTCGVGNPTELVTFPVPADTPVDATSRWLPEEASFNTPHTVWYAYSEYQTGSSDGYLVQDLAAYSVDDVARLRVADLMVDGNVVITARSTFTWQTTTGATPLLRPSYSYYRAGGRVRSGAVVMDKGHYYWTDDVNWSSPELTVIMVAVLREPENEWYGVLETASPDLDVNPDTFGLRYTRQGTLALWSDQVLASVDLVTGMTRPAQPVVVGFNIDMVTNVATLLSVDSEIQTAAVTLPQRIDPTSRLMMGRSPLGELANANMDVLEVAYFETAMSAGGLHRLLASYDRLYGVTTS